MDTVGWAEVEKARAGFHLKTLTDEGRPPATFRLRRISASGSPIRRRSCSERSRCSIGRWRPATPSEPASPPSAGGPDRSRGRPSGRRVHRRHLRVRARAPRAARHRPLRNRPFVEQRPLHRSGEHQPPPRPHLVRRHGVLGEDLDSTNGTYVNDKRCGSSACATAIRCASGDRSSSS